MRISHKYKFIFISKPRCATTTVRKLLNDYSDVLSSAHPPFHHHATALELKLYFDEIGWKWNDYFKFVTLRNPWDMLVSYYHHFKPDMNGIYNWEKSRNGFPYNGSNLISFENWIKNGKTYHRILFKDNKYYNNIWVKGFSKLTLCNTILDEQKEILVDRIIKFENLEKELQGISKILGIKLGKPESYNISEHSDYRIYFNPETKKIVQDQFEYDIEAGKYKF